MKLIKLGEDLLLSVKKGEPIEEMVKSLCSSSFKALTNDSEKMAFWINIYNAFYQILAQQKIPRQTIFNVKQIEIGHHFFSLDDIEHGILRKRKWKFSLGYLPSPFYAKTIKQLEVTRLDYRIHFALNCGSESCPAIAFYHYNKIDSELETATISFLEQEVSLNHETKVIELNKIFLWYKADFGGNKGIKKILNNYLSPTHNISNYTIKYREYDYTPTVKYL